MGKRCGLVLVVVLVLLLFSVPSAAALELEFSGLYAAGFIRQKLVHVVQFDAALANGWSAGVSANLGVPRTPAATVTILGAIVTKQVFANSDTSLHAGVGYAVGIGSDDYFTHHPAPVLRVEYEVLPGTDVYVSGSAGRHPTPGSNWRTSLLVEVFHEVGDIDLVGRYTRIGGLGSGPFSGVLAGVRYTF